MKNWKQVPDSSIRHIWKPDPSCQTDECDTDMAIVDPTFYQDNGEPTCQCGQDMIYSHSEVAHEGLDDEEFAVITIEQN